MLESIFLRGVLNPHIVAKHASVLQETILHRRHPFVENRFDFVSNAIGDDPVVGVDYAKWSDILSKVIITVDGIRTRYFFGRNTKLPKLKASGWL